MKRLRDFIIVGTLIGSTVMFLVVNLVVSAGYQELIISRAETASRNLADLLINSIFQMMRKGWSRNEIEEFLETNKASFRGTLYHVDVHRGEAVEKLYGRIEQDALDDEIRGAFRDGNRKALKSGSTMRYLYPLAVKHECVGCHANAGIGEVLGVIDIREDLAPVVAEARNKMLLLLLLVSPIPLIIAFVAAGILNRRIGRATGLLHARIEKINRIKDLRSLEMDDIHLGFGEFNDLFAQLKGIIRKLRDTAVDKDILEFEVRLLERFVITSEVVKDWKDHVKQILVEINKIMEAYFLFSLFLVDDESYDLEVFWRNEPGGRTKEVFERITRGKLSNHPNFRDIVELTIHHNVALPQSRLPELKEEDIEFQTKALILEAPKIGGIVGIGVNSELSADPTRFLVIDSILTTLLNVVGSVKAIYKYTKDLEYFATRDPLTDLFNQRVFWELLYYEMERSKRHANKFSLIVIDIDNFKTVNDTYGHVFGDNFLREFAVLLRNLKRKEDILVRYGGDEFTAILPEADTEQAYYVAQRFVDSLREFAIAVPDGTTKVKVTASLGISVFPDHAQEPRDLFLLADNMMYRAKSLGKNRIGVPSQGDVAEVFRSIGEKNIMITRAIEEKRIIPYFQPIMKAGDRSVDAFEVLMRINMPERTIAAGEFIEIAESMGVISRMDYLLMEKALEKVREHNYNGYVFFNFSPKALILSEFIPNVRKLVRDSGIDPSRIVFEITERDTVRNIGLLERFVLDLKFEGFKFAIDDFGSGFSSYQYIKRFPIDFVKVEGEFIRGMASGKETDRAIVMSIATLAKGLGVKTVAEYVEDEEVLSAVEAAGMDYAQGFYIGRPSPGFDFKGTA